MPELSPSTQKFVEIKEIKDGVVYLKSGGIRQILIVSGINFDLKSEAEQNLILHTFQNMLNAIDFSVQFFIHSRKVNVDDYLEGMTIRKEKEENELLRIQIEEYVEFIKAFVVENAIISKTFFVIVPYDPIIMSGATSGFLNTLKSIVKKPGDSQAMENIQKNLEQLGHRVNQIISSLEQVGLRAVPLDDEELTELFYNLYNPQLVEKKRLEISK
ncbi:hypothetical protein HY967_03040 [Candidatus Jorgensenbacteria bacterium]|nr:hypothetical protein [Candidatus Jorgensenbacteria bacterium]